MKPACEYEFDLEVEIMNTKVKCSLCDMEFIKNDPLIEQRKKRHEEKHTRGWNYKGRENGGGNNTIGSVYWITIGE